MEAAKVTTFICGHQAGLIAVAIFSFGDEPIESNDKLAQECGQFTAVYAAEAAEGGVIVFSQPCTTIEAAIEILRRIVAGATTFCGMTFEVEGSLLDGKLQAPVGVEFPAYSLSASGQLAVRHPSRLLRWRFGSPWFRWRRR